MLIDARFSSFRMPSFRLRARRYNLDRAFPIWQVTDMKKCCFFLLYCITKRKNLWEEIKAETTYRIIPYATYEVVVYLMLSIK